MDTNLLVRRATITQGSGNSLRGFTKIIRTENLQREENEKYGIITEDTVKRLSNCRFKLITGRVIKNESKIDLSTDLKLEIEILEVKDTYYRQRTTSSITGQSMISDISRIEPEK